MFVASCAGRVAVFISPRSRSARSPCSPPPPDFGDAEIQAAIDSDELVVAPQAVTELFARAAPAGPPGAQGDRAERPPAALNSATPPAHRATNIVQPAATVAHAHH